MTKILIDEAVVRQAMEYLQDNQHLIADNERHAYVMEYNAFAERFEQAIAEAEQPEQQEPVAVETDKVICPNCVHQFRAIPVDVQQLMLDAGFEPPFTTPPAPAGYAKKIESLIAERDALKAKLAEQPAPAQEPDPDALTAAYMSGLHEGKKRKPWVGLTDEEIVSLIPITGHRPITTFARDVEAKLKEKNA